MCFGIIKSSVRRKAVVAVTGLVLLGFVSGHMLGNLQIYLGPEWLNAYAQHLQEWPLLVWPVRAFLLLTLIVHMSFSLKLAFENRWARPQNYIFKDTVEASFASRTMVLSGLLLFFFILYHLAHFSFGITNPGFFHLVDAKGRHDVYSMVVLSYKNIFISGVYLVSMVVLYLHLSHGAPRFLQTLGFSWTIEGAINRAPTLQKKIETAGKILAWIIFIGNSSIPIAVLLGFVR